MINVAVIGIGNAGNQIADLAFRTKGIPAIAMNSSEHDLSMVSIPKIPVGTKGSGKDRNIAKDSLKENFDEIYTSGAFENFVEDKELIFIISSTGGGTGSGTTPILYDLFQNMYPGKKIILIGVLPELRESVAAQQNAIEFIKEIKDIEDITYMLYDNNRRTKSTSANVLTSINEDIVEDLCIIRGDYQYSTCFSSIDEKDMFKILNTPGMLSISRVQGIREKDIDDNSIEEQLVAYIKHKSPMCEIERDGICKRMGLIVNLNEKIYTTFDKEFPAIKKLVGEPLEGFEHDFVIVNDEYINRIILLMSGLSIPDDRIERMGQRISEVSAALTKTKKGSLLDDIDIEGLRSLRKENKREVDKDFDVSNIFNKYIK
jgi:tubulin-like protein CetZ